MYQAGFLQLITIDSNMKEQLIKLWEEKIAITETLIEKQDKTKEWSGDMLAIMIARKNQLQECINDLNKATNQQ